MNLFCSQDWLLILDMMKNEKKGATSEYPATDTPSLNLQVRGWINIKLSATVVRSVLLKCYRGPQSRSEQSKKRYISWGLYIDSM